MIHFEITQSPDLNVKTSFQYFKNEVYLGNNALDLCIADPGLKASHLLIEVPEKDLLLHPQKDVEYYLINGKRATAIRKLKAGDTVTFGNTTLKIVAFEHTVQQSKKEILNEKLNQLIEQGASRLSVIEKITRMTK